MWTSNADIGKYEYKGDNEMLAEDEMQKWLCVNDACNWNGRSCCFQHRSLIVDSRYTSEERDPRDFTYDEFEEDYCDCVPNKHICSNCITC